MSGGATPGPVRLSTEEAVATIALDPPGARFDRATLDALERACGALAEDRDRVYAVVVEPAGADLGLGWGDDAQGGAEGGGALDALAALPQPTVCAVRGRALSCGLELALPEVAEGRVPGGGGTQRLPRAVGVSQALRLLLTSEEIDAAEALRIGLVSEIAPPGGAVDAARAVARRIAARGPVAVRVAKEAVARGIELPLAQALRLEHDLTVLLQATADREEGVRAFLERRPPRFEGR